MRRRLCTGFMLFLSIAAFAQDAAIFRQSEDHAIVKLSLLRQL
jgi:hypothetical protein